MYSPKETEQKITAQCAFSLIMVEYQEAAFSSGDRAAQDYAKGAESGKVTHSGSSQTVVPSVSDFIVDVENCAKRSLNRGQLAYFNTYYRSGLAVVDPEKQIDEELVSSFPAHQRLAVRSLDLKMRELVGQRLIDTKVFPSSDYFTPKDVREKAK